MGLTIAALIALKLTATNAISKDEHAATMNIHQFIVIRYAKSCSHLFIKYQATGNASTEAINVSFTKSLDNNVTTLGTEAPNTFLTPISFVLFSAMNALKPNKPKQAMKIESAANTLKMLPNLFSERY